MSTNKTKEMPTERSGIFKNPEGFLINKDYDALEAYKKKKEKAREFERLQHQVETLKEDITEIKNLLRKLVT